MLIFLGRREIGRDEMKFVAFIKECLYETEDLLFVCRFVPAWEAFDEVEYVHWKVACLIIYCWAFELIGI